MSGTWVVVGQRSGNGATTIRSTDGLTWATMTSPLDGLFAFAFDVTHAQDKFVAVGANDDSSVTAAMSPDGVTWTTVPNPLDGGYFQGICYSETLGLWVGVGGDGADHVTVITSPDLVTWTVQSTPFDDTVYGNRVIWAEELGLLVAVGWNGSTAMLITSPDAVTWTLQTTPFDTERLNGVAWNGSMLVVVGSDDTFTNQVITSPDGVTWTARTTPLTGVFKIAYAVGWDTINNVWLVGCRDGSSRNAIASPDGITWTSRTTAYSADAGIGYGVGFGEAAYLLGQDGNSVTVQRTEDYVTWATLPNGLSGPGESCYAYAMAYVEGPPPPPPPPVPSESRSPLGLYALRIFDKLTGTKIADVALRTDDPRSGLVVTEATRELNQPGDMMFQWPTLDPAMIRFGADGLEGCKVQLWRAGFCWWWGVVTGTHAQADYVVAKAQGWLWCFDGLKFGPITTNYIANPDFSTGDLSSWGAFGVDSADFDPSIIIRTAVGGVPGSARLVTASANQDAYLEQTFSMPSHPDQDVVYTIAGWYRIDPTVTYDGPAYLERGLYVALIDAGNVFVHSAPPGRINNRRVGLGTPARLTTQIAVPAGDVGASGRVRLYCPGVAINWGAISATVQESVGTGVDPGDVTDLLGSVVLYAQGLLSPFTDKINYGIAFQTAAGGANPLTGYLVERHYQFFDLQGILDAIYEWPSSGIADVGITWNTSAPTVPCFEVFPGLRGSYKPQLAVEWVNGVTRVRARNLLNYSDDLDVNRTYDEIVVLGQGAAGSDREFGRDRDLTDTPWVLRQNVRTAPPDAPIDTLDPRATKALGVLRAPVRVPVLTVPGVLCTDIEEGDTIPVRIDYGYIQTTATHRIVRMTLDPVRDQLRLEVNVAT